MSYVLIIEDDDLVAFSVEEALTSLGFRAFELVDTVKQAVELATMRCPELIVADQQITDGTGVEAVQAICADKPIPVVFVTGSGQEVRERLPEAFVVDKPFSLSALHFAISAAADRPFHFRAQV